MESYHLKLKRDGEMGEGDQKVQNSSHMINKSWGYKVQHGDYSYQQPEKDNLISFSHFIDEETEARWFTWAQKCGNAASQSSTLSKEHVVNLGLKGP